MDLTPEDYCRHLESYLCRKNDGHLVRIVGPAFEQVCGWATRGVPITIAQRGIDRYFDRYYAKGPRRRPVRVEFCEADVLDVFDEWRRAVGVPLRQDEAAEEDEAAPRRPGSLAAHLDRVIARLTGMRAGDDRSLDPLLDDIVRELDVARGTAKGLRGPARSALLERLRALDASLVEAVRSRCDTGMLAQLGHDADAELRPFRDRMPDDAYQHARRACIDRSLRERWRLPVLTFE